MKTLQDNLSLALRLVTRVIPARALLPEQEMVRLTTHGPRLALLTASGEGGMALDTAADPSTSLRTGTGEDTGLDVLTPARLLADLLDSAPSGENIELRLTEKGQLSVSWPRNCATLATMPPGSLHWPPDLEKAGPVVVARLRADDLRAVIPQVAFAAAKDEARPQLTGLCLSIKDGQAELAATDGFHLMTRKFTARAEQPVHVILPTKFCNDLWALTSATLSAGLSAVESEDPDVKLSIAGNTVIAEYGGALVWAQIVEGTYPDYTSVTSAPVQARALVSQAALLRLAKSASVVQSQGVALQLRPGLLAMYANTEECGDVHPVTAAQCADTFTALVNPKLITPAIKAMPKGDLELRVCGERQPVMLSPDAETLYVLMPLQGKLKDVPEPPVDLFTLSARATESESKTGDLSTVTDTELAQVAANSYSAAKIPDGKVKKPFLWKGDPYVAVSFADGSSAPKCVKCVMLAPREKWNGQPVYTYAERQKMARQGDDDFGYRGVLVSYGKQAYVLTGETLTVLAAEAES